MTREKIRYIIELDPDQVETVAETLKNQGVDFDPAYSMMAMLPTRENDTVFTGEEADWAREKINEYLQDLGEKKSIRHDFHRMSLEARRDLLNLAALGCAWNKDGVEWMCHQTWQEFTRKHPRTLRKGREE